MSENTYQDLEEANWNTLWHKHGRLKPGQPPPPYPGAQRTGKNTLAQKVEKTMTHPLNKAAEAASNAGTPVTKDLFVSVPDTMKLHDIAVLSAKTAYWFSRQMVLKDLALLCACWLEHLGISDPWQAMCDEYDHAKQKHGDMTLDSDKPTNEQRFFAVVEEIGEIAKALTYDQDNAGNLADEITQLGALALAWLTHEIRKDDPSETANTHRRG